jgi:predicted dienelactone hydrolase
MDTSSPTISAETANHVLFHFGRGGYQAGSFTTHLLSAFAAADQQNFHHLAEAFPEYGAAVAAIQYDPNGVTNLQTIARGEAAA